MLSCGLRMNLFLKQRVRNKVRPLESTHLGHPELAFGVYEAISSGRFLNNLIKDNSLSASFRIENRTNSPKHVNNCRRGDLYQRSIALLREFFFFSVLDSWKIRLR